MSTSTMPDTPAIQATDHHIAPPSNRDRAATDRVGTASERLWAALHAHSGGAAEELSGEAGIGRSTAAKLLSRWVADGRAARLPSDGKRSASRYTIPAPDDATRPIATEDTGLRSAPHEAPLTDDVTPGADVAEEPPGVSADSAPVATGSTLDVPADADRDTGTPATPASTGTDSTVAVEPDDAGAATTAGRADLDVGRGEGDGHGYTPFAPTAVVRGPRLAPGALRGMVEDYLREHPGEELGPTKIGRDLRRSTGAVANALERLVASGYAARTKDQPKRYSLATDPSSRTEPTQIDAAHPGDPTG